MNALAAIILCIVPINEPVTEHVDSLEANSFYDENGRLVFDQLIAWRWYDCREAHCVQAWRLIKGPDLWPQRDWRTGEWVVTWSDGELICRVRSKSYRRSFTQHDPELCDRETFSKEHRRELLTWPKP